MCNMEYIILFYLCVLFNFRMDCSLIGKDCIEIAKPYRNLTDLDTVRYVLILLQLDG